jgi:hypothetical protein
VATGDGKNQQPTTTALALDGGWAPLANSRMQRYEGGVASGPLWKTLTNIAFLDGGWEYRQALRRFQTLDDSGSLNEIPMAYSFDSPLTEYVRYIFQLSHAPDTNQRQVNTVVVTSSDIYHHKGSQLTWAVRTPTYSTGTISITAGTDDVVGVGTDWVTEAIFPGQQIQLEAAGTWRTIKEVLSATTLTLYGNYPNNVVAGAYTIRRNFVPGQVTAPIGNWTGPANNLFAQIFNGSLYVAGNAVSGFPTIPAVILVEELVDTTAVSYLVSGNASAISSGVEAISAMQAINGMQIMQDGRIVLATEENTGLLSRVRYSSHLNQAVWSTSPGGFTDVVAGGMRQHTGLGRLGRMFTLHYEDSIVNCMPTGQDDPPLNFETTRERIGTVYPRTLQTIFGKEYFLGCDGVVYAYSGSSVETVTRDFRHELASRQFFDENWSGFSRIDRLRNEYSICTGTATYVVNLLTGQTRLESYGRTAYAFSDGFISDPGATSVANDAPDGSRDRGAAIVGFSAVIGDEDDPLGAVRDGLGIDAPTWTLSAIDVRAETHALDFGAPNIVKTIERVIVSVRDEPSNQQSSTTYTLAVSIHAEGASTATQTETKTITVPGTDYQEDSFHFEFDAEDAAESWSFRFDFTDDKLFGQITQILVKWSPVAEEETLE